MTSLRQRSTAPWAGRERPGRARDGGSEHASRIGRDRAITFGFVVLAFALAFWQHPGWATADTKIDLHVDPVRFLSQVASVWTSTTDLGEVHSAQYSGYLWPMGPFFAALHSIGLGAWVVQRIWLGLMYAFSVWGMLKLLDVLVGRPRGTVHVVAAGFYLLNPYVVVFTARTSITLLGYAALPWLLLITYYGLRAAGRWRGWRGWWWAAAFAAVLASTGGGVNAAVVGWMLVGPLVLGLYEPAMGAVRWRDAGRFLVMAGVLSVLASLWWIVPLLVHVRYGIDFLQFTEQPGTIWGTGSVSENLRLMGYWTSYIGVGFGVTRPYFSDGLTMMFNPLVVGASLLLPAFAIAAFVRARRLSYGPFLLLLIVVGVVIETAGFPNGTPMRGAMDWVYHHVFVLRFMRTTNKAAPLVAVGVAGLLGLGARAGARAAANAAAAPAAHRGAGRGAGRARRAAGAGGAAARPRQGDRHTAAVQADRSSLGRRRTRPGQPAASELPRDGPAGPDLRLLQVGRDARRDPAAADFETGRCALRDAVLGSARRRPADHGRQPRPAASPRSR